MSKIDNQIFVYKSNVTSQKLAKNIVMKVFKTFPKSDSNFDLEDVDNIYRLESTQKEKNKIEKFLKLNNVEVIELY